MQSSVVVRLVTSASVWLFVDWEEEEDERTSRDQEADDTLIMAMKNIKIHPATIRCAFLAMRS